MHVMPLTPVMRSVTFAPKRPGLSCDGRRAQARRRHEPEPGMHKGTKRGLDATDTAARRTRTAAGTMRTDVGGSVSGTGDGRRAWGGSSCLCPLRLPVKPLLPGGGGTIMLLSAGPERRNNAVSLKCCSTSKPGSGGPASPPVPESSGAFAKSRELRVSAGR